MRLEAAMRISNCERLNAVCAAIQWCKLLLSIYSLNGTPHVCLCLHVSLVCSVCVVYAVCDWGIDCVLSDTRKSRDMFLKLLHTTHLA